MQVVTKDGRTLLGRVLIEGDFRSETLRIAATRVPGGKVEFGFNGSATGATCPEKTIRRSGPERREHTRSRARDRSGARR